MGQNKYNQTYIFLDTFPHTYERRYKVTLISTAFLTLARHPSFSGSTVDSVRPSFDNNFELWLPVRISAYQLEVIDSSTAPYCHSNDKVLCVPPHCLQSAPTISPPSQNLQKAMPPFLLVVSHVSPFTSLA